MKKITIYQKPTCTKCRVALKYLDEEGVDYESINYIENPPDFKTLKNLIEAMGVSPWEVVRKNEEVYKELQLGKRKKELSDDEVIQIMAKNPSLIQRPIIVKGDTVVFGRSEEMLHKIA